MTPFIHGLQPMTDLTKTDGIQRLTQAQALSPASPSNFSHLLAKGLEKVNDDLLTSQMNLHQLASSDGANLHQIMMQMEEAKISFQLMMQVRNRLLEAYQDISKMQI